MSISLFLGLALCLAPGVFSRAIENKTGALHALPSVPSVYSGTSYVVPFSRTPQGYQCSGCSAVSTFSVMYIYPGSGSTNLVLNISATGSGQCAVQEESLVITAVTPHSGAVDYYGGQLVLGVGQFIPVCFYFNQGPLSQLSIKIDGQGSCPVPKEQSSCTAAAGNTVTRVTYATMVQQTLPRAGVHSGSLIIKPYSYAGAGYTCLNCASVSTEATMNWNTFGFSLTYNAKGIGACAVKAGSHIFYNVVPYPDYLNYYFSYAIIEGVKMPVCFYWDQHTGAFAMTIDGQGSCPVNTATADCENGWIAGTVKQIWAGRLTP